VRDRGHGTVGIDPDGAAMPAYAVQDELDVRNLHLAIEKLAELHEAAGAQEIVALAEGMPRWRRGEDLHGFVSAAQAVPLGAGGHRLFSAHQMGTARMGADPQSSAAGPDGQLHDVPGVWIGDASAFPTASGVNPMVSVMALAHRTAERIAASVGAAVASA
jgi:choline dehydrogenase-like flavoprotein